MKTWIAIVCVGFLIGAIAVLDRVASANKDVERNEQVQRQLATAERNQRTADAIVNNSLHVKDPVTGLCYKYYWGGADNGGPALATIPCEAVPSTLLITGKVKVK